MQISEHHVAYPTQPPEDIAIRSDILVIEHAMTIPMIIPRAHGYLHQAWI
jgi:hypothetical protein